MDNPLPDIPEEEINEPEQDQPKGRPDFSVSNSIQTIISIGLLMATLLTLWNPRKVFNRSSISSLLEAEVTQAALEAESKSDPSKRIGILAGYWDDSPGEVCADGMIEADVNYDIATRVVNLLDKKGYQAELFSEYDLDFLNYDGIAFVAIYSGSCVESPLPPSGFSVGGSYDTAYPDEIDSLATCIAKEYQDATSLPFTYEVIDSAHDSYHIFRDVSSTTPTVRLEMGSLKTDRDVLVNQAENTAEAIVSGIMCYLENKQATD